MTDEDAIRDVRPYRLELHACFVPWPQPPEVVVEQAIEGLATDGVHVQTSAIHVMSPKDVIPGSPLAADLDAALEGR